MRDLVWDASMESCYGKFPYTFLQVFSIEA